MRPTEDIKRLIENTKIKTNPAVTQAVLTDLLSELDKTEKMRLAAPRQSAWRIVMKSKLTKFAAAAVVLIAVLLGLNYFGDSFHGSNVAWADVIKPIFNARTAVLDIVIGKEGKQSMIHDEIMGPRIRRTLNNIPTAHLVIDFQQKKFLALDSKDKTAMFIGLEGLGEIGNYIEVLRNVITDLQSKPDFRVENKGLQKLNSRDCVVFVAKCGNETITLWADPVTNLPVRIEQKTPNMDIACDNIQFDVPFDEARFSMDVPAGYKTIQNPGIDFKKSSESDFVESLRIWAQVQDGQFPESIDIEYIVKNAPRFGQGLDRYMKKNKLTEPQVLEMATKFGQGLVFIRFFKGQGQWHYSGQGVSLGDGKEPIFWYQPKESQTWRVIYGDLRIEDATRDQLNQLEAASAARIRKYEKQPKFEGRQTDQWHITGGESFAAHCSLSFEDPPANAVVMPIALPYEAGKLQSAKIGANELLYKDLGKGKYELTLPANWTSLGKTVEVVWTMPLNGLDRAGTDFRTTLRGLVPATYYSLEVILDEGCGYEFTKPFEGQKKARPFFASSPNSVDCFGSCGLALKKSQ